MPDIRELYENGDFDAIRQMLDMEEARAEEEAKKLKAKAVEEARVEMVTAIRKYCNAAEIEMREEAMERFITTLVGLEQLASKSPLLGTNSFDFSNARKFNQKHDKPIVISTTGSVDDEVLKRFLDKMGILEKERY